MQHNSMDSNSKSKAKPNTNLLINYAICVFLMPFVIMAYQYQRNIQYLSLWHVLIFCLITAALLLAVYHASKVLIRSCIGAFLFTGSLFVSFFMYRTLLSRFTTILNFMYVVGSNLALLTKITRLICILIIAVVLTNRIKKVKWLKDKGKAVLNRLAIRKTVLDGFSLRMSTANGDYELYLKTKLPLAIVMTTVIIFMVFRILYYKVANFLHIDIYGQLFYNCYIFFALMLVYICRKYSEKLNQGTQLIRGVNIVALVMMIALLLQNIAGIVMFASEQKSDNAFYKQTFDVSVTLEEQPNIYWFHCDGMLGFDSMSRFFGDGQEGFVRELEERGFYINREAAFWANHST